jgi:hypothetical protein
MNFNSTIKIVGGERERKQKPSLRKRRRTPSFLSGRRGH